MSQQYRLSFYFGCNIGKLRENETIHPNCVLGDSHTKQIVEFLNSEKMDWHNRFKSASNSFNSLMAMVAYMRPLKIEPRENVVSWSILVHF